MVVDDHLLLDLLAEDVRGWLANALQQEAVYTTTSWYYRLASASEHGSGTGSLSGRIAGLPQSVRSAVRLRLLELPQSVGLIDARVLVMAGLRIPRRLNYLSAEATALAVLTEATVAVRTDNPLLRDACSALHVGYRVVDAS